MSQFYSYFDFLLKPVSFNYFKGNNAKVYSDHIGKHKVAY